MISRSFERPDRTVSRASDARNRYKIRYTRTQHRPASRQVNDHGRVSGTHRATITGTPNPNIDHHFTDRPLVGDPWHEGLERASIRLGWHIERGVVVPDPDALLYAAATERPPQRRLFRERVEELAAMIADVAARAKRR